MQSKKRPVADESNSHGEAKRTTRRGSSTPASANNTSNDDEHPPIKTEAQNDYPLATPVTKNTLMWFRNDLRLQDNRALYAASMRSRVGQDSAVIALYVLSPEEWHNHDEAAVKIDFWMRNLVVLKTELAALDIPLVVRTAEHQEDVATVVRETVRECGVSHVFWNRELMVDEQKRDRRVKRTLEEEEGVVLEEFDDQCIVPPRDVRTKTGNPYAVFTPFYKTWCHLVETNPHYLDLAHTPEPNRSEARTLFQKHFAATIPASHPHGLDVAEIQRLFPAGEQAAHARLSEFVQQRAAQYHVRRDVPHEQQGCSMLSAYLNAGVLSTRQCVVAARAANRNKIVAGDEGLKTWIKELGWREFYRNILVSFPRVCKSRAFQPITEKIQWSDNQVNFRAWCQGKTGFPIDLMINWQWGEKYFMQQLIDGDLASNNGGWQWSASTGTDAQPYFRVFNPLLQSQRFDPNGTFIRRWVPELKGLTDKQIHEPHKILTPVQFAKLGYPRPIVDHATAKTRYVEEFKRVLATK
ncbi:hypothetical protein BGZ93_004389 [Podila epicladia]|nr:hypothetical protein BGZ93_004389 [Podila epicladia]